ncbi:hypothetical protein [Hamadaea tsunoensis]|uniref:hypothetical protein n=1 Tax=Hamadaea tsunoensis TaxID=53368 RepID=UPI00041F4409|nr:hypothetical protein [Hamadaea tsunoensis]
MKRRTLDILFSIGGLFIAALLVVAGFVLHSNANFANTYVHDQLAQEQIFFKTAATLTDEEKKAPCLTQYAGQQLTTGKQAECYANQFIGLHVKSIAAGKTYAQLGDDQAALRTQLAAAQTANAANVADLQKQLDTVTAQRETLFKGEALRGMLLTSYGFSEFGAKAGQAALVAFLAAGLMLLLALAGLVHAFTTAKNVGFAVVEEPREPVATR